MKQLVRHNVFETNSSSCHSITISSKDTNLNDIPMPNQSGEIELRSGEFGWEISEYNGFYEKAAYLIVYIRDWSGKDCIQYKEIFERIIKEMTQCETIVYEPLFWDSEEQTYEWEGETRSYVAPLGEGYIDHQSVECRDLDYMFEDTEQMKFFLFNSNSVLYTDNDNH